MGDFTPTDQQAAIFDAVKNGWSFVVEAGAGTGKTTTLAEASKLTGKSGLYLAYNKAIVTDSAAAFPDHIYCSTAHSVAYRAVGHVYATMLRQGALQGWQIAKALGVRRWSEGDFKLSGPRMASLARATIKRWARTMDPCIDAWHVPVPENIAADSVDPDVRDSLREAVVQVARKYWMRASSPSQMTFRFDHDWYLKMFAHSGPDGSVPQLGYGLVLFDECQDADPVIRAVFEGQVNCQRIAVGDSQQAIYAWRGAENAIARFREAGAPMFPLTTSWRFGATIADEANRWLDELDADIRLTGNPNIVSEIGPINEERRHMVLCRTNAGVMGSVIRAIEDGVSVAMVGCDKEVKSLANACERLSNGSETDHPELIGFNDWSEVVAFAGSEDCDNPTLRTLVKLAEKHTPAGLSRALAKCVGEREARKVVSTAHKAKGRQAEQVFIGSDFGPDRTIVVDRGADGEPKGPSKADLRLAYVAVTRARRTLDNTHLQVEQLVGAS